jgi:hypothetical protein
MLLVGDFTTVMWWWTALVDDQLARDTFVGKWDRRRLRISTTLDGWVAGDFFLDSVAGEILINVFDHLALPDSEGTPDGSRPLSQRRVDALAGLSNWYINGDKPDGNPSHVNAVIDVGSLTGDIPEMAAARCDLDGGEAETTRSSTTPNGQSRRDPMGSSNSPTPPGARSRGVLAQCQDLRWRVSEGC